MKAVISIYKSDAVALIIEKKLKRGDVDIICSPNDLSAESTGKYDELFIVDFPLGMATDEEYWKEKLVKKAAPKKEAKKKTAADKAPELTKEELEKELEGPKEGDDNAQVDSPDKTPEEDDKK